MAGERSLRQVTQLPASETGTIQAACSSAFLLSTALCYSFNSVLRCLWMSPPPLVGVAILKYI